MVEEKRQVHKVGGSLYIVIPPVFARHLNFKNKDILKFTINKQKMEVTK